MKDLVEGIVDGLVEGILEGLWEGLLRDLWESSIGKSGRGPNEGSSKRPIGLLKGLDRF